MREPAHCRGATSKSGFPTIQASSWAQGPSNALKPPGTTTWSRDTNSWWTMHFQSNNTPITTLNFDFWGGGVEETPSPSTATIASWFQHHTHKSMPYLLLWCSQERFHYHLHWQAVLDFNTVLFLIVSQQTRHELCPDATHLTFFSKIWWQDPMLMPTSSAISRIVKWRFPQITAWTLSTWSSFVDVECYPGLGSSPTDILPSKNA